MTTVTPSVEAGDGSAAGEDPGPHPVLTTGWGRTAPTLAQLARPDGASSVADLVIGAPPRGVLARGLGRSYGDAAQNAGGRLVDMTGLARVHRVDVEEAIAVVDAGMSLDALLRHLLPLGLMVPVTPGTRYVTVGGAIASDVHGKNHHLDGGFCCHVRGFDLLLPSGEVRPVTPDGDPDLFWATAGGMGLTGVVLRATLALLRVETSRMLVDTERARDLDDVMARMVATDRDYRYSVAWIDLVASGAATGRSVLLRGDHAPLSELSARDRDDPLRYGPRPRLRAPGWVPAGLLRPTTVRAFNEAYYRLAPRERRGHVESLESFFHPLDAVLDWNRIYGPQGFLQYQFVVPYGAEHLLRRIVETLSRGRWPSFLAVLKQFGPHPGLLSFPLPGWTLALDIPAGVPGLGDLLDGFDEQVAEVGGRVYFAKDARLRPELVPVMYPRLARWQEIQRSADPAGVLRSDLARRLGLLGSLPP